MTVRNERGQEARSYFIACEQGLKVATHKLQSQPQLDFSPLVDAIATITKSVASLQDDVKELKENQKNRYLIGQKYPSAWYKRISPKFKMLQNYFGITRNELYHNIYKELEDTYDIDVDQIHEEYAYENHLYKDECYPMDAIEHHPKLRDALTLLLDSALIKYGLQTEEQLKHFKRETIFDRDPITNLNIDIGDIAS